MNRQMGSELERIRELAKKYAVMEGKTVVIYACDDGTYGFCPEGGTDREIIEYISRH